MSRYYLLIFIIAGILVYSISCFDRVLPFHRSLPKIELHAHLHGSIRPMTILDLAIQHSNPKIIDELESHLLVGLRDLNKCFRLFGILHELVSNRQILQRIMHETLEDMMNDNIIYAELRSTPRDLSDGTSMSDYIQTMMDIAAKHNEIHGNKMIVKLLISIDRSKDVTQGFKTLDLVMNLMQRFPKNDIVGLDFSGNPLAKSFREFEGLFLKAKELGFKITLHAGELPRERSPDPNELDDLIKFRADRLGHALYLEPSHIDYLVNQNKLLSSQSLSNRLSNKVPAIEICPTSNKFTMNLSSYQDHPIFWTLYNAGYPISINTDDSGVFATSLSDEYYNIQKAFELTNKQLADISASTIDQIFAEELKSEMRSRFFKQVSDNDLVVNLHSPTSYSTDNNIAQCVN